LKLSISHIIKILVFAVLIHSAEFAQQKPGNDSVFVMQKSPWGAVLRSAIIPGWGQIYNHSYIKAPVIWGAAAWFIYGWHFYNDYYQRYKDLYKQYNYKGYRDSRELNHDERDMFAVYLGLLYIMNLVDAYVDAQLFDFTVEENPAGDSQYMIGLKIKF
jgi:hypothetical protein